MKFEFLQCLADRCRIVDFTDIKLFVIFDGHTRIRYTSYHDKHLLFSGRKSAKV